MPATNGHHLAELGFDVIYEDIDYPPFSELPRVFARLRELGKPFVVIMPCSTLTTRYFRDPFPDIQVIVLGGASSSGSWWTAWRCRAGGAADCLYFCWRLGLPRDVVFLTDGRFYPPVKNETKMTR